MKKHCRQRVHNRHGFQNFGGRSTSDLGKIDNSHMLAVRWIHHHLQIEKKPYLTTTEFDESMQPVGAVIRYDLRKHELIQEHRQDDAGALPKRITLTKKAELYLKYTKHPAI